jgi:hypothetical protein
MDFMREVVWAYKSPALIKDDLGLANVLLYLSFYIL